MSIAGTGEEKGRNEKERKRESFGVTYCKEKVRKRAEEERDAIELGIENRRRRSQSRTQIRETDRHTDAWAS